MSARSTRRKKVAANSSQVEQVLNNEGNMAEARMWLNEIITRSAISSRLGMQFNGERDLYATFGYKRDLHYEDYRAMYDRLGMATRLVEKFSNDTWNKPPTLIDGNARSDDVGSATTPFLDSWNALVKRVKLWQACREADIMCGMGRYSIIFLGLPGSFETPVTSGQEGGIYYVSAYDEKQAEIKSFITDEKNERYGMPEFYEVNMDDYNSAIMSGNNITATKKVKVHHSRCIHVSENRLGSRVFGRPRLKEVYNTLMDIEKVRGGGAEAAWLAVYMGFLLLTREGVELPPEDSEEWHRAEEAIQAFAHRIQRYATLRGVDKVESLGVHEVRIRDIYTVLVSDLAGSKGIPQRVLIGSERGELASTQDMHEWNGVINSRRTNFAEPEILDQIVKRCIDFGVVPSPKDNEWTTEWQPVYAMSEMQEADYLFKLSQAANMLTNGNGTDAMDINEFRGVVHLPPKSKAELAKDEEDNTGTPSEDTGEVVTEPIPPDTLKQKNKNGKNPVTTKVPAQEV